jgi:hypothetical protein
MARQTTLKAFVTALALVGAAGLATRAHAAATLRVERSDAAAYPTLRAYVSLVNSSGAPLTGLSKENFKVLENKTNEVAPTKVVSLESSGLGVAVAVVVQKSGSMLPAMDEIKKSVAGFLAAMGEKDQAAVVVYADQAEVLAPMGVASSAAGAASKIDNPGIQKLMFDGVATALSLFPDASKLAGRESALPLARAVVIVGDGGDSGSSADVERLVAEAKKKKVPIFAVGHSETGGAELEVLKDLASRATGPFAYVDAPEAMDLNKSFNRVKDLIAKQYVVEWKADDIESDEKSYPIDVAIDVSGTVLRGSGEILSPKITYWQKINPTSPHFQVWKLVFLVTCILLLVGGIVFAVWWFTPDEVPVVNCPVCSQQQAPDWDVCLFCLKAALATLKVSKGAAVGKVYPLVGKTVKVGKGQENAIKLGDAGVSTNHCGVQIDGSKFEIVDLNSKNGTYVNGKRVQRRFLRNGDMLTLGTCELKFESKVVDMDGPDYSGDEG